MQPSAKLRSLKDAEVDDRVRIAKLMDQQSDEGSHRNCHAPADPARCEPVVFLALVEHDLHRAQPDDQQAETNAVEAAGLGGSDVGGSSTKRETIYTASTPIGMLM